MNGETTLDFKFIEYNPRRDMRCAAAARVEVIEDDGNSLLWMSKSDIKKNIKKFGEHPELKKALKAYA